MKALRLVLFCLAIAIAIVLGWRFTEGPLKINLPFALRPASPTKPVDAADIEAARPAVDARLHATPEFAPFYDRLKATFPADYARLVNVFAQRTVVTGETASPDRMISEAVRILRQSHGILASKASPELLANVFEMQAAMLATLAPVDPGLCVDFLYGGASQAYFDFSAQHRDLVAKLAEAGLDAIVDGQSKHIDRAVPTNADFDVIEHALTAKGLSKDEIGALLDGKTFDPPIPEARLCEAGRTYLETLRTLPDETRMRIYGLAVELMARS